MKRLTAMNKRWRSADREHGAALIIALFSLMLITIVVLAFFSQARLNRQIAFSSAAQARTNIIALSALDFIKADFVAEIVAGSTTATLAGGGTGVYEPRAPKNMLPYRMADDLTDSGTAFNLVKWSSSSRSLWQMSHNFDFTVSGGASAVSVSATTAALNGRHIAHDRWNKTGFATLPAGVEPEWVMFTRQGPASDAVKNNVAKMFDASGTNPDHAIGRYAYVVWDVGGLLDINAAGYPSSAADNGEIARKGSIGFADLTKVSTLSGLKLSSDNVDALIKDLRNLKTAASGSTYLSYLTGTAADSALVSGFLKAVNGDSAFVSRQDFLQAAKHLGIDNFTPFFTTFSREKNSPSWGPTKNANEFVAFDGAANPNGNKPTEAQPSPDTGFKPIYAYRSDRNRDVDDNGAPVFNRFFPNVTVSGTFRRLNGEIAKVGEPLVRQRFDLAKLSWLRRDGSLPAGVTEEDIYQHFGLRRINGSDPEAVVKGVSHIGAWRYDHGGYTTTGAGGSKDDKARIKILTLQEVANLPEKREPDFFELLQAAILRGSLGLVVGDFEGTRTDPGGLSYVDKGDYIRIRKNASGSGAETWYLDQRYLSKSTNAGGGPLWSINGRAEVVTDKPLPDNSDLSLVYAQEKYQILQIGANIIDQWDEDNIPTEIRVTNHAPENAGNNSNLSFYGVENLPYVWSIGVSALRISPNAGAPAKLKPGNAPYQTHVHSWLNFGLWNPHQNARDMLNADSDKPVNLRVLASKGKLYINQHDFSKYDYSASSNGTQYGYASGRIFTGPDTNVSKGITADTEWPSGPAWIGFKPGDYGNFEAPSSLTANKAFTSYMGMANLNDGFGIFKSNLGWERAGIYLGWTLAPLNPFIIPASAVLFSSYKDDLSYDPNKNYVPNVYPTGAPNADALALFGWFCWGNNRIFYPPLGSSALYMRFPNTSIDVETQELTGPLELQLQYENPNVPGEWHTYQIFPAMVLPDELTSFHVEENDNVVWDNNWGTNIPKYYFANPSKDNSDRATFNFYTFWKSGSVSPSYDDYKVALSDTTAPVTLESALSKHGIAKATQKRNNNKEVLAYYLSDPRSTRTNFYLSANRQEVNDESVLTTNFNSADMQLHGHMTYSGDKGMSFGPHFYFGNILYNYNTGSDRTKTPRFWVTNKTNDGSRYSDRDFVVRGGDTVSGNISDSPLSNQNRRPIMLNRPFRNVAELGYVFRDNPWKTLDLYSANSADGGLLDVFYIGDGMKHVNDGKIESVVAGKINLNSAARDNSSVLNAILSGAAMDYNNFANGIADVGAEKMDAGSYAKAISDKVFEKPLTSLGDIWFLLANNDGTNDPKFDSASKSRREAVVRALTGSVQTRTWNLLIDIIAQTGRLGASADNDPGKFTVEGEKHYWLHVAIDRFTGEIVDQQLEPVMD